jgi:hypothetical protein
MMIRLLVSHERYRHIREIGKRYGLTDRRSVISLAERMFSENPPDLSWLVIQALERTGSPPDETGAGASRCTQQM